MKICLINCRYFHKKFNENLSVVDEDFGKYTPLSLCYIAALVEDSGHEALVIDAHAENLSDKEILNRINKYKPDMLGFSFHSAYNVHDTNKVIKYLKEKTNLPIFAGGYNFNLYPDEHFSYSYIDYALSGDVIDTLPVFLNKFPDISELKRIEGIYIRIGKKIFKNPLKKIDIRFDKLPLPSRKTLKPEKYYQYISKKKNFTILLTHTGCPYLCTFCCIPNTKFGIRSKDQVLSEIEDCYFNYNVREIDFFDAVFTLSKKRTSDICDMLIDRKINITWSCRTRIDKVDSDLLKKMYKSGCRRIYYGIESMNESILTNIKKGIHKNDVQKVITETKKAGILPLGFFMIGNPGETVKTVNETIKYAKQLDLDYAQFSMTIAKPKTTIEKELIKATGKDFWRDYILGKEKEKKIKNIWTHMSDDEIEKLTKKAYLDFYFRPKIILKHLLNIKSVHELKRYIKSSLKMIFK